MEREDVERIARAALKELGVPGADLAIEMDGQSGHWRINIRGNIDGPNILRVKCGRGSSPQWVRDQIFDQYTR